MQTERTNPSSTSQLRRSTDDRILGGVAAGIAHFLGTDPTIVRVGIAALSLLGGAGIPLYAIAWLVIPAAGSDRSYAEQLLRNGDAR